MSGERSASPPRFFVAANEHPEIAAGARLVLSREDSRHAVRSLRLRPGDEITVANGAGAVARGRIAAADPHASVVDVESVDQVDRPVPRVTVALAPPKGDRLSWAVQKLAELGVDDLILTWTERTVRKPDDGAARAVARAGAIAREAAMQSRRPFVMAISEARFDERVTAADGARIVLWERAAPRLAEVMPEATPAVVLFVGPEGSFSDAEIDRAAAAGAVTASLGPAVLRTETAAIVGATLVLARYGRLG